MDEIIRQIAREVALEMVPAITAEILKAVAQTPATAAQTEPLNRFHTERETAAILGKSIQTIARYRRERMIHCSRRGKTPVYSDAHIAEFQARCDTMPDKKRKQFENAK